MNYPIITEINGDVRPMTPEEYQAILEYYRNAIKVNNTDLYSPKYLRYLTTWFSDDYCDGTFSYEDRVGLHDLPLAYSRFSTEGIFNE